MIRWILIILLVILLIIAAVLFFRWISQPTDGESGTTEQAIPVATPDSYTTTEDTAVQGNVLQNDIDQDNDISELTVNTTLVSEPANGTVSMSENGDFTYTPNAGYVGQDSFKYEVCDPDGNCTETTVAIIINSAVAEGATDGSDVTADGDTTTSGDATTDDDATTGDAATDGDAAAGGDAASGTDNQAGGGVGGATTGDDATAETDGQEVPVQPIAPLTHAVQQGEWLIQIGRCYGANPETIAAQNGIPYPSWINPGLNLTINDVGSVSQPFYPPCIMHYTVQQGDTLYSIAERFQVPLDMLIKANYGCYGYYSYYPVPYGADPMYYGYGYGMHSPYVYNGCYNPSTPTIYPGQVLIIPVNLENQDMRAQYP